MSTPTSHVTTALRIAAFASLALITGCGNKKTENKEAPAQAAEIKIGQSIPYSGPASAYAMLGKGEAAYFQMVNDRGGVNGHKIKFISLDDGYSPPKAVENVKKLVEN